MIGVILCAAPENKKMWHQFPALLDGLYSDTNIKPIMICDMQQAVCLPLEQAVVIFKDVQPCPGDFLATKHMIAVVDASGKPPLLHMVKETGLPTITCGLSACDTITLSSHCSDSAVITLQRTIQRFDGRNVDPQELPVVLRQSVDSFLLMALAAVCFFTDNEHLLRTKAIKWDNNYHS